MPEQLTQKEITNLKDSKNADELQQFIAKSGNKPKLWNSLNTVVNKIDVKTKTTLNKNIVDSIKILGSPIVDRHLLFEYTSLGLSKTLIEKDHIFPGVKLEN